MEFLKILFNNLRQGPVTDPFPLGETFTPKRFRGKVHIDPNLCVGCGTCIHVCAAGAINLTRLKDESGFDITVWHNSCCLCGQCRYYCPTKAITLTNDWHNAHRQAQKYTHIFKATVKYDHCVHCGVKMKFLPAAVIAKIYADHDEVDVARVSKLCPECRRIEVAISEDRACHIDHLQQLVNREEVCILPTSTPTLNGSDVLITSNTSIILNTLSASDPSGKVQTSESKPLDLAQASDPKPSEMTQAPEPKPLAQDKTYDNVE